MTFGFSRDDAEGKFLLRYVEDKILPRNPFETLDRDGVGRLMRLRSRRAARRDRRSSVGICGEHGGDPTRSPSARAGARLRVLLAVPRAGRPPGGRARSAGTGGARPLSRSVRTYPREVETDRLLLRQFRAGGLRGVLQDRLASRGRPVTSAEVRRLSTPTLYPPHSPRYASDAADILRTMPPRSRGRESWAGRSRSRSCFAIAKPCSTGMVGRRDDAGDLALATLHPHGSDVRVSEHVRIRKIATRSGRPEMLDDGHVVEGDELSPPTPGVPYAVRRTVTEHEDAPDVFATSPVRAVITEQRAVSCCSRTTRSTPSRSSGGSSGVTDLRHPPCSYRFPLLCARCPGRRHPCPQPRRPNRVPSHTSPLKRLLAGSISRSASCCVVSKPVMSRRVERMVPTVCVSWSDWAISASRTGAFEAAPPPSPPPVVDHEAAADQGESVDVVGTAQQAQPQLPASWPDKVVPPPAEELAAEAQNAHGRGGAMLDMAPPSPAETSPR